MKVPQFVLTHSTIRDTSMWHFYLLVAAWASVYTAMNVAVVLFLKDALGSMFLAGLALAIGSVFALCFDGIFAHFQKIFVPRTLFLNSIFGMMLAVLLFLLGDHPAFVYLAAILFRISYDLCDITAISYVLSRSTPELYGQNLSYKQLAQGIGLIGGFLVSAVLLWTATFIGETATEILEKTGEFVNADIQSDFLSALVFVKLFLLILLVVMWSSAYLLFDRELDSLDKNTVVAGFQEVEQKAVQNLKHTAGKLRQSIPLLRKKSYAVTPTEIAGIENKHRFDMRGLFGHIGSAINDLSLVGTKRPLDLPLVWTILIMCIFSYWDTFLGTFMPIYLTEMMREQSGWVRNLPGSIIMFILIVPVLVLLPLVAKWGDRHGQHLLIIAGMGMTLVATFFIGAFDPRTFFLLLGAGFGITFGYLFVMSAVRANTAAKMNHFLANAKPGMTIDNKSSAGSMLFVDNIGNIIGTLLGGAFIELLGFRGLFFAFSLMLTVVMGFTIWKYSQVTSQPQGVPLIDVPDDTKTETSAI